MTNDPAWVILKINSGVKSGARYLAPASEAGMPWGMVWWPSWAGLQWKQELGPKGICSCVSVLRGGFPESSSLDPELNLLCCRLGMWKCSEHGRKRLKFQEGGTGGV